MPDLNELLKNIDPKTLQLGIEKASLFAKTQEGKNLIDNIKKTNPQNKDAIMEMVENNPEMKRSIEKFFK